MRKITKVKRSIRAISPVISVLLMIAIAVAAALVAYAWVSGYMDFTTTKTGKAIQIQSVSNNPPAVYVQNVGDSEVTLKSCYINGNLDPLASDSINGEKLAKSQTQEILQFTNLDAFYELQIKIKIVTTDGVAAEYIKTFTGSTINNPENPEAEDNNIRPFAVLHWSANGLTLNLDASDSYDSDGTIDSYLWTSNGAQIGTTATLTYPCPSAGIYTIKVIVTDNGGKTGSAQRIITVNSVPPANNAPYAEFTYAPLDPQTGETVTFTDASTDSDGTVTGWAWNFGDGTTSTQRNPTKAYTTASTFTVTLTVTDDDGATDIQTKQVTVTAPNVAPVADFTFTPTNPETGTTITFTDASTDSDGTITGWAWNFGDTTTSNVQNPAKAYTAAGTYTVTLTVTDNDGATNTQTKQITINTPNSAPTAAFTWNTNGLTVDFDGSDSVDSDGTIVSYVWTSDGTQIGTGETLSYTYSAAGTYTVRLTVTDDDGATGYVEHTVTVTAALTGQIHPESAYYYRGGQSYLSGPLSDMRTSNDDYYVSYSETGSSTVPRIEYFCSFDIDDIHVSESRITKLSITLEGHYTTSVNQKLYIFNLHTGMWELKTTNTVGTTDTTTTFTVDNHISNYINSGNGEIYILIETDAGAGALPYHHYNDLFQVTATYTP